MSGQKRLGFVCAWNHVALIFAIVLFIPSCAKREAEKINFLLDWKAGMEYVGFIVAKDKAFYKDVGLDVTIQDGSGASTSAKLLANKNYDLGLSTGDALVIGVEQGYPIKSVAVLFQKSPVVIYSLRESNITKVEDLVGKTIGVSTGDTKYNYFQGLLNRLKLKKGAIKEVTVGWEVAPLLTRKVDALLGYINVQPVQVELQGKLVNIIKMSEFGLDIYSEAIVANVQFLQEKPEVVRRFVGASLRGWQYAIDNPQETVQIFAKTHPEYDVKFLTESFKRVIPLVEGEDTAKTKVGSQTKEGWEKTRDILLEFQLIKTKVDVSHLFTNEFLLGE